MYPKARLDALSDANFAGNSILIAAVSFRLLALMPSFERADHPRNRQISLSLLIISSVLAIGWSFISLRHALWALILSVAGPRISRRMGGTR